MTSVLYDPTIYRGSAAYYARGRPPYSRALVTTLVAEVGLDGSSRLLDVGCGPGVLTIAFADHVAEAIGLDPDAEMLAEGARRAVHGGIANIRWLQALAEDIPTLDLGRFRLVTFGQSFHWTDRERVAEAVYDMLEPSGPLALIAHVHEGRPRPSGPGQPPIPYRALSGLEHRHLIGQVGEAARAGFRAASAAAPCHTREVQRAGAPRVPGAAPDRPPPPVIPGEQPAPGSAPAAAAGGSAARRADAPSLHSPRQQHRRSHP